MKYFSTFSGIGGFELGIGKKHECVGYSEIDRYADSIYKKHFPTHKNYGDITKINAHTLPNFDILVGGFPCQAFSIAGRRAGFDDTRGTLFFDLARILKEKRPRYFVFENVKGLLSHDNGRTFKTIISALDELGYDLQWQVLNSKNHGVPQNRERVIIVGHFRGIARPQIFPIGAEHTDADKAREEEGQNITGALRAKQGGPDLENSYKIVKIREATKKGYAEATVGDSINLSVPNSQTRRGRVGKGIAQTLDTAMHQHTLTQSMEIRRLTPTECERLQGFPDAWTEVGIFPIGLADRHGNTNYSTVKISDTQRYKVLGNAVTVNVIRAVIEKLEDVKR